MVLDDIFTDLTNKNKILGVIISIIGTGLLVYLFELGVLMTIFMFFVIMAIVWMGSTLNEKKEPQRNLGD